MTDRWGPFNGNDLPPRSMFRPGEYVHLINDDASGTWVLAISVVGEGHIDPIVRPGDVLVRVDGRLTIEPPGFVIPALKEAGGHPMSAERLESAAKAALVAIMRVECNTDTACPERVTCHCRATAKSVAAAVLAAADQHDTIETDHLVECDGRLVGNWHPPLGPPNYWRRVGGWEPIKETERASTRPPSPTCTTP